MPHDMDAPKQPERAAADDGLQTRLERHLGDQATIVPIADTPIEAVVRRGQQRRQRRSTRLGVLATLSIVAASIAGIQLLSRDTSPHRLVHGSGGGSDAPSSAPGDTMLPSADAVPRITPVPSNLTWTVVTPDETEALGYAELPLAPASSGPFLAYATEPGTRDGSARTLYRSEDGISWTPVDGARLSGLGQAAAAVDADHLYTIATAPASSSAGDSSVPWDVVLSSSSDGGVTWSDVPLPADLRGLASSSGVASVGWRTFAIAANTGGVVVAAKPQVEFDLGALTESSAIQLTKDGAIATPYSCASDANTLPTTAIIAGDTPMIATPVIPTDNTQVVIDATAPAEPTASTLRDDPTNTTACSEAASQPATLHTWSSLGVDPAAVDAYFAAPRLFVGHDAADLVEVANPAQPASGLHVVNTQLFAMDSSFAMVTTESDDASANLQRLFLSPDGRTWTQRDLPWSSPSAYVMQVGRTRDGALVVLANTGSGKVSWGEVAVSTDDGVTWSVTRLDGLLTDADGPSAQLSVNNATIGPSGVTIVGSITTDPFVEQGPATITVDGVDVSQIDQNGTLVFTDATTGEELGRLGQEWSTFGPSTTTPAASNVKRDARGQVILHNPDGSVRLTLDENIWQQLYEQRSGEPPRLIVLHSDDGVAWSRDDLAALAGFSPSWADSLLVANSRVLVTVSNRDQPNSTGKPTTVVLVGTPNG